MMSDDAFRDQFTSNMMSNLDGNRDRTIKKQAKIIADLESRLASAERDMRERACDPRFVMQPIELLHSREGRDIATAFIHEGAAVIILGTNGKPIGWIDTHQWIGPHVYRDRFRPLTDRSAS